MRWYRYAAAIAFVEAGVSVSSRHHVWGFLGCLVLSLFGYWCMDRNHCD